MSRKFFRIVVLMALSGIASPVYSQSGRAKKPPVKKPTTPEVPVDTASIAPPEPKEKLPEMIAGERIYTSREVDQKAFIISKPSAHYTENAKRAGTKGKVILRAILSADGEVRHLEVLSGLPMGLTESSLAAATQIKFLPARRLRQAVSQWVKIEYRFWVYDTGRQRWPLRSN